MAGWWGSDMPKHVLVSDMDDETNACLHGFWTDHPCPNRAVWKGNGANQWRACAKHKHPFDVPLVPVVKHEDEVTDGQW